MRRLLVVPLVALAALMLVQDLTVKQTRDIAQDWLASRALLDGSNPYQPLGQLNMRYQQQAWQGDGREAEQPTPHPPALIALFAPLSLLGYGTVRMVWLFLSVIMLIAAMSIFVRRHGYPLWLVAAPMLLPFVHFDLLQGQSACLVLLLCVIGEEHPTFLGLAAAIKIYPILILARLKARELFAALAAGAGVTLVAVAWIGVGPSLQWLTKAVPRNVELWGDWYWNISAASLLARIGVPFRVGALLVIVIAAWVIRRRENLWDAMPLVVLASPLAWANYAVVCIPTMIRRGRLGLAAALLVSSGVAIGTGTSATPGAVKAGSLLVSFGLLILALPQSRKPFSTADDSIPFAKSQA